MVVIIVTGKMSNSYKEAQDIIIHATTKQAVILSGAILLAYYENVIYYKVINFTM
jgi:hypothetical protein